MVIYVDFLTGCKNTLFSFFLSRTYVIFNKFATELFKQDSYEKKHIKEGGTRSVNYW